MLSTRPISLLDTPCLSSLADSLQAFPPTRQRLYLGKLDLNRQLIKHPVATFFVRVTGDSKTGAGIHSGELLIVDRSVDGNVIVAALDGDLTVKRLYKGDKTLRLLPADKDY
jgi:DNA polymerase V